MQSTPFGRPHSHASITDEYPRTKAQPTLGWEVSVEAFLAPLLSPVGLVLALLGAITWLSFSATGRNTRRSAAATSVLLSLCGSIAFLGLASIDDYNDYPGYTCSLRDGNVPDGFPSDRLPPPDPDLVSRFHPNIAWSHGYELFPAGVRCTYWTKDEPRVTVVTHSPWAYSVWIYGLLIIALAQAARVINPDLLTPRDSTMAARVRNSDRHR